MSQYVAGVDLGGTNIAAILMDATGRTRGWMTWPTEASGGPDRVIERIIALIKFTMEQNGITEQQLLGIGLGVPGLVNSQEGKSVFSPNLPGWRDIPVAEMVGRGCGVPVIIDNDVRMAAWGEKLLGAGRGWEDVICLTLGTGIGSGIFIQGKMFKGRDESAGEIGHVTVEKDGPRCNCGNFGCLEMYASGRGIARQARETLEQGGSSLLLELAGGDASSITAATVCRAAIQGDPLARQVMEKTALYLGIALAGLANILNPQRIVLGGGVMGAGELLLEPVRRVVRERAMPLNREVEIVAAELGERAGAIGAAALARQEFILGEGRTKWIW
ncbi:glucokinase [Moorella thermoacetica]|uniref:Glucokinase n=1 Tax=Neomoorella thermoacetica TaxID=1525 RepID=A0A1J5P100_NEOTH|nr:glucokinase [Moorella thermoacetica]